MNGLLARSMPKSLSPAAASAVLSSGLLSALPSPSTLPSRERPPCPLPSPPLAELLLCELLCCCSVASSDPISWWPGDPGRRDAMLASEMDARSVPWQRGGREDGGLRWEPVAASAATAAAASAASAANIASSGSAAALASSADSNWGSTRGAWSPDGAAAASCHAAQVGGGVHAAFGAHAPHAAAGCGEGELHAPWCGDATRGGTWHTAGAHAARTGMASGIAPLLAAPSEGQTGGSSSLAATMTPRHQCDCERRRTCAICQSESSRCRSSCSRADCVRRSSSICVSSAASSSLSSSACSISSPSPNSPAASRPLEPRGGPLRRRLMLTSTPASEGRKTSCSKVRRLGCSVERRGSFEGCLSRSSESTRRKPYVYSCCTKEESLLCLKKSGSSDLANSTASRTTNVWVPLSSLRPSQRTSSEYSLVRSMSASFFRNGAGLSGAGSSCASR
mmetsp:Transcript_60403/g.145220  ORF Transcript_60403/g.145220 Transcript_60403/m.145220 type:complete len:451 (+) Transcript_60403:196-1548(+)